MYYLGHWSSTPPAGSLKQHLPTFSGPCRRASSDRPRAAQVVLNRRQGDWPAAGMVGRQQRLHIWCPASSMTCCSQTRVLPLPST
jgi:hypothetical protein